MLIYTLHHPRKNYPTNKLVYKHTNEIWSIDSLDMSDYGIWNNRGYRYILVVNDFFSKYMVYSASKKRAQTIKDEFWINITTTKRKPSKKNPIGWGNLIVMFLTLS